MIVCKGEWWLQGSKASLVHAKSERKPPCLVNHYSL